MGYKSYIDISLTRWWEYSFYNVFWVYWLGPHLTYDDDNDDDEYYDDDGDNDKEDNDDDDNVDNNNDV